MPVFLTRQIQATRYSVIFQFRKLKKPNCYRAKTLEFLGNFGCRGPASCAISSENQKTMIGLSNARARSSEHEDGVKACEQQANIIEGIALNIADDGLETTLNKMSKWLAGFLMIGIVLWRHDTVALWATVGSVTNNVLSIALKNALKHDRPTPALRPDPGMPSSHAQSIFYIITFLNLSLLELYGMNGHIIALNGMSVLVGSYFSWLRISQRLHTVSQVMVGAAVGTIFSIFWFWLWNAYVLHLFELYLPVKIMVVVGAIGFGVAFVNFYSRAKLLNDRLIKRD